MPRQDRVPRESPPPGVGPRDNEPETPEINLHDVPRNVRAELKSLPKELAATVGAHLVAAGQLIEIDPEAAYAHAEAAKRRAARLPIAREALAETAYAAGHYDVALTEFRALRRMTGSPDYFAVLADCERALGRPDAALKLVREGEQSLKDPALLVELRIVQAGARADSGQQAEALRLLANEIESPRGVVPKPAQARLRYAYAALLLEQGDRDSALDWFTAAARIDPEGTDALDRLDELNGFVLITDF
jgi:tetratricopeptide (TPR) repeat protein